MTARVQLLTGDCRAVLRALPDESVHCVVTSPPYYNLRDYKVAGQIGLEDTPADYIAQLVAVFEEVRRVLRRDGTLWLNIGDSYAGSWGAQGRRDTSSDDSSWHGSSIRNHPKRARSTGTIRMPGLKQKDRLGIPWMLAFALREAGWWLRQENVWEKAAPMPESIKDRPTTSHEQVFLFSKSPRYFYDGEGVREPVTGNAHPQGDGVNPKARVGEPGSKQNASFSKSVAGPVSSRNLRSVWRLAPAPYKGEHFATFPPALAEICVKAGTSEAGCCPRCAAPLARIVEKGAPDLAWQRRSGGNAAGEYAGQSTKNHAAAGVQDASAVKARILAGMRERVTTGWKPTCRHKEAAEAPVPCTVLDPFGGVGTTGLVADRLRRHAILIELNPKDVAAARRRIGEDAPLLPGNAVEEAPGQPDMFPQPQEAAA